MLDGRSTACDGGMHEWCGVLACECTCHEARAAEQAQAPRRREKAPSGSGRTRKAPNGRHRRSSRADPGRAPP